jgi:4-amino-4-deoxy-L-arabinose transferase-like glycosyltransferase
VVNNRRVAASKIFAQEQFRELFALGLILIYYVFVASFRLQQLPGEWYGDIFIVHERVLSLLSGTFSFEYSLSAGPLPLLATAVFARVFGATYMVYKIASVSFGALNLIFLYLFTKELAGKKAGLLAAILASVTFWHLVMARIGNTPLMFSMLVASATAWLTARFIQTKTLVALLLALGVSFLGLWTYPAVFPLPLVVLFSVFSVVSKKISRNMLDQAVGVCTLTMAIGVALFSTTITHEKYNFTQGYIGHKLFTIDGCESEQNPFTKTCLGIFAKNSLSRIGSTLGMFHIHGDEGFRTNVREQPHLDRISGLILLVGLLVWLKNKKTNPWLVLMPVALLLLPTLAPGIPYKEVPSLPRTLGIFPYIMFLIALGVERIGELSGKLKPVVLMGMLFVIAYTNLSHYFSAYALGLPENNHAWAAQMAAYIDALDSATDVTLTDCCWGEFGQPEPKAIYYSLQNQEGREHIIFDTFVTSCDEVDTSKPQVLIFRPKDEQKIQEFVTCFPEGKLTRHKDARGVASFTSMELTKTMRVR